MAEIVLQSELTCPNCSAKTVEHHVSHIRRKLDATGVPRAAFLAALRSDLGR